MKVILAGGGTAGHINPAIAIANEIKLNNPKAEIIFIGNKTGMEQTLVPKSGFEIKSIEIKGLKRKFTLENIDTLIKAFFANIKCKKIIKDFKPDIVIGTGGYVSWPVLFAAAKLNVKTLIHEQNAFAGLTSKMLNQVVDTTCISFLDSKKAFKNQNNIVHTGNPIRSELFKIKKDEARKKLGLNNLPFIVAFGGSLGAITINNAITSFIKNSQNMQFQMLYATGTMYYEEIMQMNLPINENIKIVPYIHNMDEVMNAADLIISRAGAITISEINALGKPSILIPSPNVTDNHQERNAMVLKNNGAAEVITEKEIEKNKDIVPNCIKSLINDKIKLKKMSIASKNMGIDDGTKKIYKEIEKLL